MDARFRQFRGGYRFRRFAGSPLCETVDFGVPQTVRISLLGSAGTPTPLLVKPGATVRAGQMVAQGGTPPSSPVLAPISGTVESVSPGGEQLVIRSDALAEVGPLERRYPEWQNLPHEKLEDALYVSGITGFPAGGIPTRRGSSVVGPEEVTEVLVEAAYAGLWNPRLGVLLEGGLDELSSGLAILAKLLPRAAFTVLVDRSESALASRLRRAVESRAGVLAVPSRYPLAHEAVLLPAVFGRALAPGQHAINAGVLILDLETVRQIHGVVVDGKPPLTRTVALAGTGFSRNVHVSLRLGTPVAEILERFGSSEIRSRLLLGGPLTGEPVTDPGRGIDPRCRLLAAIPENDAGEVLGFARPGFVKDSYTKTFAASFLPFSKKLDTNLHGEERACISCGFCEDVCPARIMPQLLHRYVRRDIIDETILRYKITDCIDCNLCSYVCPSKIPVSELMRKGKSRLVEEGVLATAAPAVGEPQGGSGA